MPSLATDPPAAPRPLSRQKQPPAEPVSKANPVATAPQTAQQQAPAVKAPKAFTAEEKDNWILRALDELGGTASARGVADFLKVTDLSKVGKITAHMEDMCDRRTLVREDTRTGTVYSKATVGQTALDIAVDVEAPAIPAAAPEATQEPVAREPAIVILSKRPSNEPYVDLGPLRHFEDGDDFFSCLNLPEDESMPDCYLDDFLRDEPIVAWRDGKPRTEAQNVAALAWLTGRAA